MNFDFSQEQQQLRGTVRRFLAEHCLPRRCARCSKATSNTTRRCGRGSPNSACSASRSPPNMAGPDAGALELCVVAEELGRALAPVPYASCIYLVRELLRLLAGDEAQKQRWLPKIAAGEAIGALAFAEGVGDLDPAAIRCTASGGSSRPQEPGRGRRNRRLRDRRGARARRRDRPVRG